MMTEARRVYLYGVERGYTAPRARAEEAIPLIEAEAVVAALTALRAQVEELPGYPDGLRPGSVRRTAVLAAIDAAIPGGQR